jgi:DNA (cytosine-5)-methyltransferase 1
MKRKAVDLFCGAGGTSAGYLAACADLGFGADLLAINHWPTAIATHELNHRGVRHLCENLDKISPREAIPSRHLHALLASPECTHHSNAAGGRPRNEQSRATAWHVCRWVNDVHVDAFQIENVREFLNWGPLRKDGKPMKHYRGATFTAFLQSLASLGYTIEHRILNAADFGDPTTRERLFIIGRRDRKPIVWPAASHARAGANGLKPWRPAREIIDWDLKGQSIFHRKRPLSQNTLRRIAAGLRKFGGIHAEPFLIMLNGTSPEQLDRSIRSIEEPVPTVVTNPHLYLAEPFILGQRTSAKPRSVEKPAPTVTTTSRGIALVEPFILPNEGIHRGNAPRAIDDPLNTVTAGRGAGALVEPFLTKYHGNHEGREDGVNRVHPVDDPVPTLDTSNRFGLIEPFMTKIDQQGSGTSAVRSVDDPAYTVITEQNVALVQPFIVKYYKTGRSVSIDDPLDTVTTKDRFMLVEPKTGRPIAELDILFRMLQPHELAGAQGFPTGYQFCGTREDRVKQIGNAVPVNLATALCKSLLDHSL